MNSSIKVSASTELLPLADMIARSVRRGQGISLEVSGTANVNLAVKAIALAHDYLAYDGLEACFVASFADTDIIGIATPTMYLHVDRPEHQFPPARQPSTPEPPIESESCADQQ